MQIVNYAYGVDVGSIVNTGEYSREYDLILHGPPSSPKDLQVLQKHDLVYL